MSRLSESKDRRQSQTVAMTSLFNVRAFSSLMPRNCSNSRLLTVFSFRKAVPFELIVTQQPLMMIRRIVWSLRSSAGDDGISPSPTRDESKGRTRLFRTIEAIQLKITSRIKVLMKNLPTKLFSFLVGFYCATAFATVIGQTGDWDVLSAALMVAVVEGIGALMYNASLPFGDNLRDLITIFNYWKAGLSLGLFLDSFKY